MAKMRAMVRLKAGSGGTVYARVGDETIVGRRVCVRVTMAGRVELGEFSNPKRVN